MKTNAEIKQIGKQQVEKPFGQLLLLTNITKILALIGNIIPIVGYTLISGTLQMGYIGVLDDELKGQKTIVKDLFKFFKTRWGDAFYFTVKTTLYMWPIYVIIILSYILLPIAIILLPIVIIAIIVLIVVRQYDIAMGIYLLYKDANLNGKEALETSVKLMKGHKMDLFKLQISLIKYYIFNIFLNYGQPTIDACIFTFFEEIFIEATTTIE